jgi:septum formation protein
MGACLVKDTGVKLLLASSSPWRRELLARLQMPFDWASPDINESALPGEVPADTALRLAEAKARALADSFPDTLVIGSDQVCELMGKALGKPGSLVNAKAQLQACSGQTAVFHTGLCVYNTTTKVVLKSLDHYLVTFRRLEEQEIDAYLAREDVLGCAGSFRAEGLGVALFERMAGDDFHSLVGLPLVSLCRLLRAAGLNPLATAG